MKRWLKNCTCGNVGTNCSTLPLQWSPNKVWKDWKRCYPTKYWVGMQSSCQSFHTSLAAPILPHINMQFIRCYVINICTCQEALFKYRISWIMYNEPTRVQKNLPITYQFMITGMFVWKLVILEIVAAFTQETLLAVWYVPINLEYKWGYHNKPLRKALTFW